MSNQEQIQYKGESIEEDNFAVSVFLSYNANNLRSPIQSSTDYLSQLITIFSKGNLLFSYETYHENLCSFDHRNKAICIFLLKLINGFTFTK